MQEWTQASRVPAVTHLFHCPQPPLESPVISNNGINVSAFHLQSIWREVTPVFSATNKSIGCQSAASPLTRTSRPSSSNRDTSWKPSESTAR